MAFPRTLRAPRPIVPDSRVPEGSGQPRGANPLSTRAPAGGQARRTPPLNLPKSSWDDGNGRSERIRTSDPLVPNKCVQHKLLILLMPIEPKSAEINGLFRHTGNAPVTQ